MGLNVDAKLMNWWTVILSDPKTHLQDANEDLYL